MSDTTARPVAELPEPPIGVVGVDEPPRGAPVRSRPGRVRGALPPWAEPALLVGVGLVGCAYTLAVDPNHSSAYPQCPTKLLFGFDCPLCGATRAVHSLLRFDLGGAINHNLLFVLALPALLYAFVAWTMGRLGRPMRPLPLGSKWVTIPIIVVMFAFVIVRNMAGPFHWMDSAGP